MIMWCIRALLNKLVYVLDSLVAGHYNTELYITSLADYLYFLAGKCVEAPC